jgi:hypothetical protein
VGVSGTVVGGGVGGATVVTGTVVGGGATVVTGAVVTTGATGVSSVVAGAVVVAAVGFFSVVVVVVVVEGAAGGRPWYAQGPCLKYRNSGAVAGSGKSCGGE